MKEVLKLYFRFLKELPKMFTDKKFMKECKKDIEIIMYIILFALSIVGTVYGIDFIFHNHPIIATIVTIIVIPFVIVPIGMIIILNK